MSWSKARLAPALLGIILGLIAPGAAEAEGYTSWPVKNRLQGRVDNGQPEKSEDVSGIACTPGPAFPRLCLVVDDETQGAQIVVLTDGLLTAGDFIPLSHDSYDGKPLELDAEGVAYADGFFYVIGAHGRARHEKDSAKEARSVARAAATRKVFRIALSADTVDLATGKLKGKPEIAESAALATMLQQDPVLSRSFDQPLANHGMTIEGVAVRGDTLYAAFRGPVIEDGVAVVASAPLNALFGGTAGGLTLHRLALGKDSLHQGRGIRDLSVEGDGFLLVAGPEADRKLSAAGDYAVFAWDGKTAQPILELPTTGKVKLEALLPLERKGKILRALLMFDGAKEGAPTPVEITLP